MQVFLNHDPKFGIPSGRGGEYHVKGKEAAPIEATGQDVVEEEEERIQIPGPEGGRPIEPHTMH